MRVGETVRHEGVEYAISDQSPKNGDLVITEKYGVWTFKDETGTGSAPMPYWANKNTCKVLVVKK
jgi:hypothetical protein